MLGALAAGIGSLFASGAAAAVSLGASVLGGVTGLVGSGVSLVGSTLFGGGQAAVATTPGMQMGQLAAASAAPGGTGIVGGIAGIGGQLADILPTAGGVMSLFRKPEQQVTERAGTTLTPTTTIPTLALSLPKTQTVPQIFTTPAPGAKPDYLIYIVIAGLAFLILTRKK